MSNSKLKSALTPVRNGSCAAGFADDGKRIVPSDFVAGGAGDWAASGTDSTTAFDTQANLIRASRPSDSSASGPGVNLRPIDRFLDRRDAGRRLAPRLIAYAGRADVVVLALPRGGVPVGFEVAQ